LMESASSLRKRKAIKILLWAPLGRPTVLVMAPMYSDTIYTCNKKIAACYTIIHIGRDTYGRFSAKKFPDVAKVDQDFA
jgi:hypothetical protein